MPITFTLDLEDHRAGTDAPLRCGPPTERILDWLAAQGATGTFFIVGDLAEREPGLVRRVARAGHEIALHGLHHVPIEETGPDRFLDELRRGKAILEDAAAVEVRGYRAPIFSLTRRTPWAPDALAAAGFAYSSSVLPADSPLHGIAGMPRRPFRWRDGPVELPCPVAGRGRLSIPFLGGVYLRYLPLEIIRRALDGLSDDVAPWIYLHPYDLDPDEPFAVLPHAGYVTSRIVHHRRAGTIGRLDAVARRAGGLAPPLATVAATAAAGPLPEVSLA